MDLLKKLLQKKRFWSEGRVVHGVISWPWKERKMSMTFGSEDAAQLVLGRILSSDDPEATFNELFERRKTPC